MFLAVPIIQTVLWYARFSVWKFIASVRHLEEERSEIPDLLRKDLFFGSSDWKSQKWNYGFSIELFFIYFIFKEIHFINFYTCRFQFQRLNVIVKMSREKNQTSCVFQFLIQAHITWHIHATSSSFFRLQFPTFPGRDKVSCVTSLWRIEFN